MKIKTVWQNRTGARRINHIITRVYVLFLCGVIFINGNLFAQDHVKSSECKKTEIQKHVYGYRSPQNDTLYGNVNVNLYSALSSHSACL